jgi:RNA polymerase sigma-70 factor (sigma-E family)
VAELDGPVGSLSFDQYVLARGPWLERVAFMLSGDAHLAEDLVQQTLLRAYRRWPKVAEADQPDAYVRRILINQFRSHQRRRPWVEVASSHAPMPEIPQKRHEAIDEHLWLHDALGQLPPRTRAVVVLRYLEDLDVAEVAELLNVTPSSVRATASRALTRLQTLLITEES